jgi:hypothetical protein
MRFEIYDGDIGDGTTGFIGSTETTLGNIVGAKH